MLPDRDGVSEFVVPPQPIGHHLQSEVIRANLLKDSPHLLHGP